MIETESDLLTQVSEIIWKVLVSFCFSLTLLAVISLFLNIPISNIHLFIGAILCLIFVTVTQMGTSKTILITGLLLATLMVLLSVKISISLLDFSFDGRCYHYLAIHSIQAGWNPIYDPLPNSWPDYQTACAKYSMLYPKSYWYAGAIIEKYFGNFEAAKSINLLWGTSVFFLSFSKLGHARLRPIYKVFISAAIVLNPAAITQWLTNYTDGQLYYSQVIVIVLLISQIIKKNTIDFFYMGFVIVYLFNIKFSSLPYLFLYLGAAVLYMWFRNKEFNKTIPFIVTAIVSIILAVFLVGYNPYLTNYFNYKDPLYPWGFITKDPQLNQETILNRNRPADFNQLNRFGRFYRAIFSTSSNEFSISEQRYTASEPKNLFSIELKEILAFQSPDVRSGGFGPWFSGAFVLSGILLIVILIFLRERRNITLFVVLVLFLSVFITEEGWWARYAPQTWLIPVFALIPVFEKSDKLVFQGLGIVLLLILLVNSYLTSAINISSNISASEYTKSEISKISSMDRRIVVRFNNMLSFEQMLNRYNLRFSVIEDGASFPCPANYIYGLEYSLAKCKGQNP